MNAQDPNETFLNTGNDSNTDSAGFTPDEPGMSMGGDATGDAEFTGEGDFDPLIATETSERKFNAGSLVIVAVIVMACAGLFFMRSLSHVNASTAQNMELEASIENFLKDMDKSQSVTQDGSSLFDSGDGGVLTVLTKSYTERQVPLDNVERNPFIIFQEPVTDTQPNVDTTYDNNSRQISQRRAMIEQSAERFELKSVIVSSNPKAILNGKIVMTGDEISTGTGDITFTVKEIKTDSLILESTDEKFGLVVQAELFIKRD